MLTNIKYSLAERRLGLYQEKGPVSEGTGKELSLVIVLDSDERSLLEGFSALEKDLGVAQKNFRLLICPKFFREESENINFSSTDIGWGGRIKKEQVKEFFGQRFDVLIAYTQTEDSHLEFVINNIQAGVKIGRKENQHDLYDLSIFSRFGEIEIFIREVKKYLKILTIVER